ncbi:sensor histidine kinase [Nocardia sp. NBC_01499]|uniref:sensor histidine kinase n=1 Tax=Nocardia sp. NBC_01499 TaxID=2903597 RepID=UPI00386ABF28
MTEALANARARGWPAVVAIGPYLLLALLAMFTVLGKPAGRSLVFDLLLCALAAAWMLWMVTLHPEWRAQPPRMAVFFTVLLGLSAILVVRDPWFGLFTPAAYVYAFRLLPWPWRLAGVAAVAMIAGTAQAVELDKSTVLGLVFYLAVLVANAVPMCGFAWFAWHSGMQDEQRRQALVELSAANKRLEATLSENAGLHEQLLSQARAGGVRDERERMAREIHDTLAQGLTGIITQLHAAEHADADPVARRRHVGAATTLARESLSEARRSVHALRPEQLETARLSDALTDVAARWSALHDIPTQAATTGTARPLPTDVEVALLRTAQEALANVAKHARATRVGVTLSYMENEVVLDVRDDGAGFDPDRLGDNGFGLVAMRQRVEALAGSLRVESEPGGGTGISACVPASEVRA